MNSVTISWPSPALSPNARGHWSKKSKAAKIYRAEAWGATMSARVKAPATDTIGVHLAFYPPNNIRRDQDNMRASMKSAPDGLADALGVDDSRFDLTYSHHAPVTGGKVILTVGVPAIVEIPLVGVIRCGG